MATLQELKSQYAEVLESIRVYEDYLTDQKERKVYLEGEIKKLETPTLEPLPAFKNQDLINAVYAVADIDEPFQIIRNAGLAHIADRDKRQLVYSGQHIRLLNLPTELKTPIIQHLVNLYAPKPARFKVSGNQILLEGKPFRFVGCNIRELAYYASHVMPYANQEAIAVQLGTAQALGMRVVRFYASHQDFTTAQAINRVKATLDDLAIRGLYGLLCFTDNKWTRFQPRGDTNYRGTNGVEPFVMYFEKWYESGYKEFYKPFVVDLLNAIGNHRALFAVDIANEPQLHPLRVGDVVTKARVDKRLAFFQDMTKTIRGLTPALVTSGAVSAWDNFELWAFDEGDYAKQLSNVLDFMVVHTYQDPANPHVLGGNEIQITRELRLGIPLILEEFGGLDNHWVAIALSTAFSRSISGVLFWGFMATEGDIGSGDPMGMTKTTQNGLPGWNWEGLVSIVKGWTKTLWNNG